MDPDRDRSRYRGASSRKERLKFLKARRNLIKEDPKGTRRLRFQTRSVPISSISINCISIVSNYRSKEQKLCEIASIIRILALKKTRIHLFFTSHLRLESLCTILPIVASSINFITDSCVLLLYLYFDYVPLSELASSILLKIFILMISNWRSKENSNNGRMSSLLYYFLSSMYLSYHIYLLRICDHQYI